MFKDCNRIEKCKQSISVPEKGKDEVVEMESGSRMEDLEVTQVGYEE